MNGNTRLAVTVGGVILAILILVPVVFGLIWGWPGYGYGMMGMMGGFGWMGIMPVLWLVLLGLIIWAVVAALRSSAESGGRDSSRRVSALDVLKKRYARGEISREEYEEKKKDLV